MRIWWIETVVLTPTKFGWHISVVKHNESTYATPHYAMPRHNENLWGRKLFLQFLIFAYFPNYFHFLWQDIFILQLLPAMPIVEQKTSETNFLRLHLINHYCRRWWCSITHLRTYLKVWHYCLQSKTSIVRFYLKI